MKHLTEHLWFETPHQRDYLNITVARSFSLLNPWLDSFPLAD